MGSLIRFEWYFNLEVNIWVRDPISMGFRFLYSSGDHKLCQNINNLAAISCGRSLIQIYGSSGPYGPFLLATAESFGLSPCLPPEKVRALQALPSSTWKNCFQHFFLDFSNFWCKRGIFAFFIFSKKNLWNQNRDI